MSAPPAPTRTDRRRAQTRQNLVSAARSLIAENGVAGLRVGAITERADVALGSFYNYFESKDEVVEAIVSEAIGSIADSVMPLISSADDPAVAVSVSIRQVIQLAHDDPQLAWLLVNLDRAEARFETMILPQARAAFERGVSEGRFDIPEVAVAVSSTAGGALAVMRGILEERLPADAGIAETQAVLRSFGIEGDEAKEIASRDLPKIEPKEKTE